MDHADQQLDLVADHALDKEPQTVWTPAATASAISSGPDLLTGPATAWAFVLWISRGATA